MGTSLAKLIIINRWEWVLVVVCFIGGCQQQSARSIGYSYGPVERYDAQLPVQTMDLNLKERTLTVKVGEGKEAIFTIGPKDGWFDRWRKSAITGQAEKSIHKIKISDVSWNWRWEEASSKRGVDAWTHKSGYTISVFASGSWTKEEIRRLLSGLKFDSKQRKGKS